MKSNYKILPLNTEAEGEQSYAQHIRHKVLGYFYSDSSLTAYTHQRDGYDDALKYP